MASRVRPEIKGHLNLGPFWSKILSVNQQGVRLKKAAVLYGIKNIWTSWNKFEVVCNDKTRKLIWLQLSNFSGKSKENEDPRINTRSYPSEIQELSYCLAKPNKQWNTIIEKLPFQRQQVTQEVKAERILIQSQRILKLATDSSKFLLVQDSSFSSIICTDIVLRFEIMHLINLPDQIAERLNGWEKWIFSSICGWLPNIAMEEITTPQSTLFWAMEEEKPTMSEPKARVFNQNKI